MIFIVLREKNSVEGPLAVEKDLPKPTVDINTLGFTGSIAVKDQASLELLKSIGPLKILEEVSKKV